MKIADQDLHEAQSEPGDLDNLDDESIEDILCDCHYTVQRALSIKQPKWLTCELRRLEALLENLVSWHSQH